MRTVSTQTRIRANITDTGLDLFIHSPEIGNTLATGSFLNWVWKNVEDINSVTGSRIAEFSDMVKYFAKHPKLRSSKDLKFLNRASSVTLFNYLTRKFEKELREKMEIEKDKKTVNICFDGNDTWIVSTNNNSINLGALTDFAIEKGKVFSYKGVFSQKFVDTNILPSFRAYSSVFIKTFCKS